MSSQKKIAIIGGSYLQLPAVRKARDLGYEVHCFSWADGAVCADEADFFYPVSIVEKERILEICREIGIDGITTIASDLAVLTVVYVATRMNLVCNPEGDCKATTDKYEMRRRFAAYGIPSPNFAEVSDTEHPLPDLNMPVIVKPTDRSGSRGVEKVTNPPALINAVRRALSQSFGERCIVEEYIDGREISVESISFDGHHHILQITDKVTTGAPYFVETEHHQPTSLSEEMQTKVRYWVPKALDALGVKYGASHSEIKIDAGGNLCFIEIGARMGGDFIGSDLVQLSTGYDYLGATIRCAMGEFEPPRLLENACSGVYFLSKDTERVLPYIRNWRDYPQIMHAEITDSELHHIECSGDRSGYLIYKSERKFEI